MSAITDTRWHEAELAVLAACLHDAAALQEVAATASDDWWSAHARALWKRLREFAARGEAADYYALLVATEDRPEQSLLEQAWSYPRSAFLLADGLRTLRTEAARREALSAMREVAAALQSGDDPEATLPGLVDKLTSAMAPRAANQILDTDELLDLTYREADRRMEMARGGQAPYLPLGLPRLEQTLMVEPGHLVELMGPTGRGKTALALWIARSLAWEGDDPTPVLVLNTEMGAFELGTRLLGQHAMVPISALRAGSDERALAAADRVRRELKGRGRLLVSDALPDLDSTQMAALARRYRASHGIRVLIVDYVQRLADAKGDRESAQWQRLMDITGRAKSLAQELGIVVILVTQATDDGEMAQSRGMARDADSVVAVVPDDDKPGEVTLVVRKNRHGPRGSIRVRIASDSLVVHET